MIRPPHQLVLFLIVSLSLSSLASGQRRKKDSRAKIGDVPTVDFCDLTVRPERYVGKLVRVKASLVSWWESSYLYNVKCESSERKIHDALDCSGDAECEELGKHVHQVINRQQRPDKDEYAFRAYVTLVGKLVGPSEMGFGHLNWAKFEFRIRKVEAAAPMPSDIPYAKETEGSSSR
jgi:hypothetical protein